jgi:hypothetical protein
MNIDLVVKRTKRWATLLNGRLQRTAPKERRGRKPPSLVIGCQCDKTYWGLVVTGVRREDIKTDTAAFLRHLAMTLCSNCVERGWDVTRDEAVTGAMAAIWKRLFPDPA